MTYSRRSFLSSLAASLTLTALAASPAWAVEPPEEPLTKGASAITVETATVHGELNPGTGTGEVEYFFAYNNEGPCVEGWTAPESPKTVTGNHKQVATQLTELLPSTTYRYCLVAANEAGSTAGAENTFTTLGLQPTIDSEASSGVSPSSAFLQGEVNPENQLTTYYFEFATSEALSGPRITVPRTVEGLGDTTAGPVAIAGLAANQTYFYRLVAANGTGTTHGPVQQLTTLPDPPAASTGAASQVTSTAATVQGTVDPGGLGPSSATTYYFQYGPTTGYGSQAPSVDAGVGESPIDVSATLTGLYPGTTYHYRIVATNDNANTPFATLGTDMTFTTTPAPPVLSAPGVPSVSQDTATVTATLQPSGLPTRYELQIAATPAGMQTVAVGNSSSTAAVAIALTATGLSAGTAYDYRLIATNPDGSAETATASLTTLAAAAAADPLAQPPTPPLLAVPEFAVLAETVTKPPAKPARGSSSRHRLAKALKKCRHKHATRRKACEREARRRYRSLGRKAR